MVRCTGVVASCPPVGVLRKKFRTCGFVNSEAKPLWVWPNSSELVPFPSEKRYSGNESAGTVVNRAPSTYRPVCLKYSSRHDGQMHLTHVNLKLGKERFLFSHMYNKLLEIFIDK